MSGRDQLDELLRAVAAGELGPDDAAGRLRTLRGETAELGFAEVDHDRAERCGFPEVVLCDGKEPDDAAAIAAEILRRAPRVLLTRADDAHMTAIARRIPNAVHHRRARCVVVDPEPLPREGLVAVVAAGTADLPVADEARVTAEILGARVDTHLDVGIAGLHRLLTRIPEIRRARAVVAVAGMEGALPSVLAGLLDRPVIAVPTSVGYGVGHGGLTALATMLASCAAGVTVVNIDNGFGAGYAAALVNRG